MADLTEVYAALQKADAAGDTAGAKQLADYIRTQSSAPPAAQPSPGVGGYAVGALETVAQAGTGLVSTPVAGLSGLGTMAGRALGLTSADPADIVRNVQNKLTYQPRTAGGQSVSNIVSYLPGKLAQGADYVGGGIASATGSPLLGAAANTGIQALPLLLGGRFLGRIGSTASAVSPEVQSAVSAGLKLTPEQAQSGFIGRSIQSLTGSAKLERTMSRANAGTVDMLAAQEAGIQSPITPASIAAAKAPHNAVYDQVSQVGTVPTDAAYVSDVANVANRTGAGSFDFDTPPAIESLRKGYGNVQSFDSGDAVQKIRQLRADSSKNLAAFANPEQNALGTAQRQIAKALEDQLDRHIQNTPGLPGDLITQFRTARMQLAKINTVADAMEGPNVSARLLNKEPYLSGNLKTISNAYENFPRSLQDISRIRDSGPFSALDTKLAGPLAFFHPAIAGSIVAPPLARAALASNFYQRSAISGKPLFSPTSPALSGAAKSIPTLTQEQQQTYGFGLPSSVSYLTR